MRIQGVKVLSRRFVAEGSARGRLLLAGLAIGSVSGALVSMSIGAGALPTAATGPRQVTCRGVPATIVGTSADDTLVGTAGPDVIVGGGGADEISGGAGDDLICGGPTRDKESPYGDPDAQTLDGGAGDDVLIGGPGMDELNGAADADLLIGRGGPDDLQGDGAAVPGGTDVLRGGPGPDMLSGDAGDDRAFGGADDDWFEDPSGANHLDGGDGADTFASGPGDDDIVGGPGSDIASYVDLLNPGGTSSHCGDVVADLTRSTGEGPGFGSDTLVEVEGLASGGGNDVLVGDDGPNTFYTGYPCYGVRRPVESVTGGDGADRISFDSNQLEGSSAPGPVRVDLARQTAWWTNGSTGPTVVITMDSIEDATGTGEADVLLGDAGPNTLVSGPWSVFGADVIRGRGGDDRLLGFRGAQRLYGGGGADDLSGGGGADRLDGGPGRNHNDGGLGIDVCRRPASVTGAIACER